MKSVCTVEVRNRQREISLVIERNTLQAIVEAVLASEGQEASCVGIHFVSDRVARKLHRQFFSNPSSTDCMSFPLDDAFDDRGERHLGEVVICPATAFARTGPGKPFWNELTLYIVHGLLHLLGYDDTTSKGRATMRQRERRAIRRLSVTKTKKYA